MGTVPLRPFILRSPRMRLWRLEDSLRDLDVELMRLLDEPERLRAPWFEGYVDQHGRYRPSLADWQTR